MGRFYKFITEEAINEMGFMIQIDKKYKDIKMNHPAIFKRALYGDKFEIHFKANDLSHAEHLAKYIADKFGSPDLRLNGKFLKVGH